MVHKFLFPKKKSEKDKIKFYDYTNKRQYEILIENPLLTIKKTINRIAHFSVLDPTHNYYYNDYRGYNKQPPFIESQTHKKLIPYRIIYTLLIYFVCFFGFCFVLYYFDFYMHLKSKFIPVLEAFF